MRFFWYNICAMTINRRLLVCLVAVAIVGMATLIAVICRWSLSDDGNVADSYIRAERRSGDAAAAETVIDKRSKAGRSRPSGAKTREKPVLAVLDDDEGDDRTPAERDLEERIEKALEDEDFEAAIACAGEALKCKVGEIRQNMVDTLGWFGAKALPELTPFLADDDNDVRESAMSEWTMALADIEDDAERIGAVESAMGILNDEDSLDELSNEYIGVDEKLAVESLVRIIDGGGSKEGVEKAKETYEFVTGDEWASTEEAARWIAEEYEPSDEP